MDCIDNLLRSGEPKAAWKKAQDLLATKSIGPQSEDLLLYLLSLTLHYGCPETMLGFIDYYSKLVDSNLQTTKKDHAFSNGLQLVFTALTDGHNQEKINLQTNAVGWSHLVNNSILQTFRFSIESLRKNPKEAKKAITCAIRAANNCYEKAFIAAAISIQKAKKNRPRDSISIAKRSIDLLQTEYSLRASLLKAQLSGHIGKTCMALGDISTAQLQLSKMTKLLEECRSFYPAQIYIGSLITEAKYCTSPKKSRQLVLKQISSLSKRWPYQKYRMIHALFTLNDLAIERRDFNESRTALKSIYKILPNTNQRELTGYYYRDLAKLIIYEEQKPNNHPNIVDHILRKAETIFSKLGNKGQHGMATTLLIRGEWLLQKKKYKTVLNCVHRSLGIAKAIENNELIAYSTLLESFLLLESELENKLAVYEGILFKLAGIQHPALLFRVLSNLYLYSWDFPSQLDATNQLMKNIRSLQTSLSSHTFRRLWKKHISNRVFSRLLANSPLRNTEPARLC